MGSVGQRLSFVVNAEINVKIDTSVGGIEQIMWRLASEKINGVVQPAIHDALTESILLENLT